MEYPDKLGYDTTEEAVVHGARDAMHDVVRLAIVGAIVVSAAWAVLGKRARKVVDKWTS